MSKVVLFIAISLDGYIAKTDGSIDWLINVDTSGDETYENFYKDVSKVVLGRKTYDQVVNELSVGDYPYKNIDSYVLTTKETKNIDRVKFVNTDVVSLVRELKESDDVIWIVGGTSIITPLIEENLIDEYQIAIVPILLGDGIPLFKQVSSLIDLELFKTYQRNQLVYLNYRKVSSDE